MTSTTYYLPNAETITEEALDLLTAEYPHNNDFSNPDNFYDEDDLSDDDDV